MKENTTIKNIFIGAVIGSIITGAVMKVYSYWNTGANKTPVRDIEPITYQNTEIQTDILTNKDATTQENLKPNECKVGTQTNLEQHEYIDFEIKQEFIKNVHASDPVVYSANAEKWPDTLPMKVYLNKNYVVGMAKFNKDYKEKVKNIIHKKPLAELEIGTQTDDEQFKSFFFSSINESTEISLIELIGKNDICEE